MDTEAARESAAIEYEETVNKYFAWSDTSAEPGLTELKPDMLEELIARL